MKKINAGPLVKIGAVLLIATLLMCTVGIAANGWNVQPEAADRNETDAPKTQDNETLSAAADDAAQISAEPVEPQYESALTGAICTRQAAENTPFCFLADPSAPLYGVYSADIAVEIPTEEGKTRLALLESDSSSLGKIGALTKTRAYIDSVAAFFGAIPVSYGRDDLVNYPSLSPKASLDLSASGYCYMENVRFAFTSGESVASCSASLGLLPEERKMPAMPYLFCERGAAPILGPASALSVRIPYAADNETAFFYSEERGKYVLNKNGKAKTDLLTGRICEYDNLFVLFADTVTYGRAGGTETVFDTLAGGSGYYISKGKLSEIRWNVTEEGALLFRALGGEQLVINRGKIYIAYYPSCASYDVIFE